MADTPIRAESNHSPRLPPSGTRASSPERVTKGFPKRSITPHRHIFSDFGEAHRKITRSATTDPFHSPFDGNGSSEDVSSRSMRCRSPSFPLQNTEEFPPSLQQNAASGFSQVYPEVQECGRCLTGRKVTPVKTIDDISPSINNSVELSTTSDLSLTKKDILPTVHASENTVGQTVTQYVTKKTAGQDGPAQSCGLQLPKTRKAKNIGGDGCQNNECQVTSMECGGSDTADTESSTTAQTAQAQLDARPCDGTSMSRAWGPFADGGRDATKTTEVPKASPSSRIRAVRSEIYDRSDHRLIPQPLCVPSHTDHADWESLNSSLEAEASTRSSPSKYDSKEYHDAMDPDREREVSKFLNNIIHIGDKTCVDESTQHADPGSSPRSLMDKSEGSFFDPNTLRLLNGETVSQPPDDFDAAGLRILINAYAQQNGPPQDSEASKATSNPPAPQEVPGTEVPVFGLTVERGENDSTKLPRNTTNMEDWQTETTSEIAYGTRHETHGALSSIFKPSGSSIADLSDYGALADHSDSRVHILQKPSSEALCANSNAGHATKPPQQYSSLMDGVKGVGGRARDSIRSRAGIPMRSHARQLDQPLRHKITNPFAKRQQDASRHTKPGGQFSPRDRTVPHKYDFRDSGSSYGKPISSTMATGGSGITTQPEVMRSSNDSLRLLGLAPGYSNPYGSQEEPAGPVESNVRPGRPVKEAGLVSPSPLQQRFPNAAYYEPHEQQRMTLVSSPSSDLPTPIGTRFAFSLVDLPEAQALEKSRRERGDTVETRATANTYSTGPSSAGLTSAVTTIPSRTYTPCRTHRASTVSSAYNPQWIELQNLAMQTIDLSTPEPRDTRRKPSGTPKTIDATPESNKRHTQWFRFSSTPRQTRLLPLDRRFGNGTLRSHQGSEHENAIDLEAGRYVFPRRPQLSDDARKRQAYCFYVVAFLSVFPFIAWPASRGALDAFLPSLTEGEVASFSPTQQKILMWECRISCIVTVSLVVGTIVYFLTRAYPH